MEKHRTKPEPITYTKEYLSRFLSYDATTGEVRTVKRNSLVHADLDGWITLKNHVEDRKHKLKLVNTIWMLYYGEAVTKEERILYKNMDSSDTRISNLVKLNKKDYKEVTEAYANLMGGIKIAPHTRSVFSCIVYWHEQGQIKHKICSDAVGGEQFRLKLRLHFSKILTKHCLFEE